jgi:hypothetical protein
MRKEKIRRRTNKYLAVVGIIGRPKFQVNREIGNFKAFLPLLPPY